MMTDPDEPCRTLHPEWADDPEFPGWPCLVEDDLCLTCGMRVREPWWRRVLRRITGS